VTAAVDELFQFFADFEERQSLRGNRDGLARARIATRVRFVRAHREAAEATDFNPFAALERFRHRVEDAIDDELGARLRQVGSRCHRVDELALRHGSDLPKTCASTAKR